MKKYTFKDADKKEMIVFADSMNDALHSFKKSVKDAKFYIETPEKDPYDEWDFDIAKKIASKYGLQFKTGRQITAGPNKGYYEAWFVGPKEKLRLLAAETDNSNIDEYIEDANDSYVADSSIALDILSTDINAMLKIADKLDLTYKLISRSHTESRYVFYGDRASLRKLTKNDVYDMPMSDFNKAVKDSVEDASIHHDWLMEHARKLFTYAKDDNFAAVKAEAENILDGLKNNRLVK